MTNFSAVNMHRAITNTGLSGDGWAHPAQQHWEGDKESPGA